MAQGKGAAGDGGAGKRVLPGVVEEVVYERDDGTAYLHHAAIFEILMEGPTVELVSDKGTYKVPRILIESFSKKPPTESSIKVPDGVAVFLSDLFTGKEASTTTSENEGKLAGDVQRGELNVTGTAQGPPIKNNPRRVFLRFSTEWLQENFVIKVVDKETEGEAAAEGAPPADASAAEQGKSPPQLSPDSKAPDELTNILRHERIIPNNVEELGALAEWLGVDWAISWPLSGGWRALLTPDVVEMELLLASLKREAGVDNARVAATRLTLSETFRSGHVQFVFNRALYFSVNRMAMRRVMTAAMVILCQENEEVNKLMLKAARDGWPWWEDFGRGMEVDPETGKIALAEEEDDELLRALEVDDADALIGWIVASKGGDFNCKVNPGSRVSEVLVWALDDDVRTLSVLVAAAAFGCANCVRVLLSNGATADHPALKAALYGGNGDAIRLLQSRVQMSDIEPLQLAMSCARGWNFEGLEFILNEHCPSFLMDDYQELCANCHMGRTGVGAAQVIAWSRLALDQAEKKWADYDAKQAAGGEGAAGDGDGGDAGDGK